jgi:membrane protein DedA with SNARE-associated domain
VLEISNLVASYGYLATFALAGLQTVGLPIPGEAALITASVYAARTGHLNIVGVLVAAAAGSWLGGALGYWIGRNGGHPCSPATGLAWVLGRRACGWANICSRATAARSSCWAGS